MNFWDALYAAANNANMPTTKIGPALGLSREYVATNKSKKINTTINNAVRLFGACDCGLYAIPDASKEQIPDDAIRIDASNTD